MMRAPGTPPALRQAPARESRPGDPYAPTGRARHREPLPEAFALPKPAQPDNIRVSFHITGWEGTTPPDLEQLLDQFAAAAGLTIDSITLSGNVTGPRMS